MTPEDILAKELRGEIDARVGVWKEERRVLQAAATRIAELDALIALADDSTERQVRVAARERVETERVR